MPPADAAPALARVEAGGLVRGFPESVRGRASIACAWGNVRLVQIELEPQEVPEGFLLNHAVSLNLGRDASWDANIEGRGWQTLHTPHHGVGVLPARLSYAAREHERRECLVAEIAPDFAISVLGPAAATLLPVAGERDPFAAHVLLALAEESRAPATAGAIQVEGLATALVAHLLERYPSPRPALVAALSSPKLRRVLDYVAAHLDAPLTLRKLAEVVEMDLYRFVRAFKQSTGLSPHRYVLDARITRAKELLRLRVLSITEIALRTGFSTPSHFSVTFRRIAKTTPRAYRDGTG